MEANILSSWNRVTDTPQRLKEALEKSNMKQADLARATGIDKGSIHHYLTGRYEPKAEPINKMAIALNVSEMWLWGYDVPMERETVPTENITLTEGEKKWLELYNLVSDDAKKMLIKIASSFDKIPAENQRLLLDVIRFAAENQK